MVKRQPLSEWQDELRRTHTTPPSLETLRRWCKEGRVSAVQGTTGRWYRLIKPEKPHKPRRNIREPAEYVMKLLVEKRPPEHIYLAESGGRLKIGWTRNDPEKRMRGLQTSNPYKVSLIASVPGRSTHERMIHSIFSQHRITGEWFNDHPDIRWFFDRCQEKLGEADMEQ